MSLLQDPLHPSRESWQASKEGGICDGFVQSWLRIPLTEKSQGSLSYRPLENENAYFRRLLLSGLFYSSGSSGGHAVS